MPGARSIRIRGSHRERVADCRSWNLVYRGGASRKPGCRRRDGLCRYAADIGTPRRRLEIPDRPARSRVAARLGGRVMCIAAYGSSTAARLRFRTHQRTINATMLRAVALLSFIAVCAFGDPLTLTVLSGTEQASAVGYVFGPGRDCSASGPIQASCMAPVIGPDGQEYGYGFGQANTSWSTVSASGSGVVVFVPGVGLGRGQALTSGGGTSAVAERLLVTGGTGPGYLILNFSLLSAPGFPTPSEYVTVNGQCIDPQSTDGCQLKDRSGNISGFVPFTFGQPFSFEMYVTAGSDGRYSSGYMEASIALTSAVAYDAYPYPTGIFEGGNPTPDIPGTDVTGVLVSGIPEPNTAVLAAGVLCFFGIARLRRFKRMADQTRLSIYRVNSCRIQ